MAVRLYADDALQVPAEVADDWLPFVYMAKAAGREPVTSLPCEMEDGPRVRVLPIEGAQTQLMQAGTYAAELSFLNSDNEPVGPYARWQIHVYKTIAAPTPIVAP